MIHIIVAHPDDELLWCYEIINSISKKIEMVVHCLTNKENHIRYNEFKIVMEKLAIKYFIYDFIDSGTCTWNLKITNHLKLFKNSDMLITHSLHGEEHSHIQHKQIFLEFHYLSGHAFFSDIMLNCFIYKLLYTNDKLSKYKLILNKKYIETVVTNYDLESIYKDYTFLYIFNVNIKQKHSLLDLYKSQIAGLKSYKFYNSLNEYLYSKKDLDGTCLKI